MRDFHLIWLNNFEEFDGGWIYVGFPGVITSGSFEAEQPH